MAMPSQPQPTGTMAGNTTFPYASQSEIDSVQSRRDLSIVFVLILLAIPLFIGAVRLFHPRRIKALAVHEYFLFSSMIVAAASTSGIVTELRFAIKPDNAPINRGALTASVVSTMEFFGAVTLARIAAMLFALRQFGDKTKNPGRETIINRVFIIIMLVGSAVQGVVAIITTITACSPPSSAWKPRKFRQDCHSYSQVQVVHASIDVWKNTLLIVLFVVLYVRKQSSCRLSVLKYCILIVAIITTFSGLARTIFLKRHVAEVLPPVRLITPKILLALEMDLDLAAVALLTITSAIKPRCDVANMELEWQDPEDNEGNYYGPHAKAKMMRSAWDDLPDLQFQSDNPNNDFKRKIIKPLMLDQGTMTSPKVEFFVRPPSRVVPRQRRPESLTITPAIVINTIAVGPEPPVQRTPASVSADTLVPPPAAIPPLPFSNSGETPLETPAFLQRPMPYARRNSIATSTTSSSLSPGPFSEAGDNDDEIQEVHLKPPMHRANSVAQLNARQSSVAQQVTAWNSNVSLAQSHTRGSSV